MQVRALPRPPDPAMSEYYDTPRIDLLDWAGALGARALEIGCGAGANAGWLRAHGAEWIEGVEPHADSASLATERFDRVHPCRIEDAPLDGAFDLIICADVIEHLVDPGAALTKLRERATRDARLLISVPNIRYYRALWRIAFGAGFRPEPSGTFDGTHLRFFTRANLSDLLHEAGWRVERFDYPAYSWAGRTARPLLARVTRGATDEWLVGQWFVRAAPEP